MADAARGTIPVTPAFTRLCRQLSVKGSGKALSSSTSTANIKTVADSFAAVNRRDADFILYHVSDVFAGDGVYGAGEGGSEGGD